MNRSDIVGLIVKTVREVALTRADDGVGEVDDATPLFGADGLLDSLGLVSVVVDVEGEINDRLGLSISIADERAMSRSHSPFRTVGSLADYVVTLLDQGRDG